MLIAVSNQVKLPKTNCIQGKEKVWGTTVWGTTVWGTTVWPCFCLGTVTDPIWENRTYCANKITVKEKAI